MYTRLVISLCILTLTGLSLTCFIQNGLLPLQAVALVFKEVGRFTDWKWPLKRCYGQEWKKRITYINHLYTYVNGFFLLVWYNMFGIVHCTYVGMSGYNFFKKYCIILSEDLFYLYKQCRPWWNAAWCGNSSGSSLFVKVSEDLFYLYKQCRPWWNAEWCDNSSGSSMFVKVPVKRFPLIQGLMRLK